MARRRKKLEVQEEVSPNLIPMVDIMFLLLLFFMLGADMGQRDLEEVKLPEAVSVKKDEQEKEKGDDRLTVNVYHLSESEVKCLLYYDEKVCRDEGHWRIGIRGRDFTDVAKLEAALREAADPFRTDTSNTKASERPVMVRADSSAPYGEVQKVLNTCAKVGIYKIECGAAQPANAGVATK